MKPVFLQTAWADLDWTPFILFARGSADLRTIPRQPGLYLIKVVDEDRLAYIGQTGRNLRERISDLMRNALAEQMPYNDPHTAAPRLWSYRDAEGMTFEASAAPIDMPKAERLAVECSLLWEYRRLSGVSPFCNFGRLHPSYRPSRNRSTGIRGGRLPGDQTNQDLAPSLPALNLIGTPDSNNWMGLDWPPQKALSRIELEQAPTGPGVYRLNGSPGVLYFGEATNLRARLRSHCRQDWQTESVTFASVHLPEATAKCQRLEIESDLIAGYYAMTKNPPIRQFGEE